MFTLSEFWGAITNPAVTPVWCFLGAIALHVIVGTALHLFRLRDFDWAQLGKFVENDYAVVRGIAILTTGVLTLSASFLPGADLQAAFVVCWVAFVGACGSATLPILRDCLYDFIELVSGTRPMAKRLPKDAAVVTRTTSVTANPPTR